SGELVLGIRVLLRIRHEDARTDRLDAEWTVTGGQIGVDECARARYEIEVRIEHVDTRVVEVSGVEPVARGRRRQSQPLVDRAHRGPIRQNDGLIALRRKPATDLARLGVEDKSCA